MHTHSSLPAKGQQGPSIVYRLTDAAQCFNGVGSAGKPLKILHGVTRSFFSGRDDTLVIRMLIVEDCLVHTQQSVPSPMVSSSVNVCQHLHGALFITLGSSRLDSWSALVRDSRSVEDKAGKKH